MKTHFNNPEYIKKVALMHQQQLAAYPPAILYAKKRKENTNASGKGRAYQKVSVPLDPNDPDFDAI